MLYVNCTSIKLEKNYMYAQKKRLRRYFRMLTVFFFEFRVIFIFLLTFP